MRPRAFTLELTKGCNLRCGYCYYAQREEAYDPRTRMSDEVAERSVELLLAEGPPGEPIHLHFFGGEPLLDFPLLARTVRYAERRSAEEGRGVLGIFNSGDDLPDGSAVVDVQPFASRHLESARVQAEEVQHSGVDVGDVVAAFHHMEP